ncbi:MAG: 1,4-dihydroxy-2-naphthoate polyprenyltransferase [Nocardiopsaceae bacterium]|nr:1,4-dihydroxy-2-naphthoate polyprenyltransferase [Nocardiopsaceae bacterium]
MATGREWLAGTRPRTLPAAVVPVLIGSGVAAGYGDFVWWRALLALVVALALQVGVNFANDYSDGIRGSDDDGKRVGPMRLVGSGAAAPRTVLAAAFGSFGVAGCAGLVLAAVTSWWLVLLGVCCVAGAWFYTGGSRPYGYQGLGEVAVFVFFGVAAVAGTALVQMGSVSWLGLAASIPAGLLSCALLMINNLRDIASDGTSGKRTLAVKLGDARSRIVYILLLGVPFVLAAVLGVYRPLTLLVLLAVPLAIAPVRAVRSGQTGPALITALGQTGRLQMAFGIAFTVGLAVHL